MIMRRIFLALSLSVMATFALAQDANMPRMQISRQCPLHCPYLEEDGQQEPEHGYRHCFLGVI